MRTRAIRAGVIVVCIAGVAAMIVTSATGHNGAAITFGLITAVAILCQMVATTVLDEARAVARAPRAIPAPGSVTGTAIPADTEAAELEDRIAALVADGAREAAVRDVVRRAVSLGRRAPASDSA